MEIIERLRPWMRFANFVGLAGNGEPFLHPQIMQIFRAVAECGATPSALTNGTRLRQEFIEELPTLGPSILMVSVDGGVKELSSAGAAGRISTRCARAFSPCGANANAAKTPFPIVNFITCLMKENLGETEQIVDLAARAGGGGGGVSDALPLRARLRLAADKKTCARPTRRWSARAAAPRAWQPRRIPSDVL
jgi:MoaA/NifB/PqqE/SkfB family radical SAM enzyme